MQSTAKPLVTGHPIVPSMTRTVLYNSFSAADTGIPTLTIDAQGNVTNNWKYNPGGPGQIVVVRVMYQWPVFLGPLGFSLATLANGNRLIMASSAFQNEP